MRKVAASLVVFTGASIAFGGTVTFNPDDLVIDPSVSTVAQLSVSVAPTTAAQLQSLDVVIGSDDLAITGFTYDPAFVSGTAFRVAPAPFGAYPNDIYVGGFLTNPASGVLVGMVSIDAAGLAPGIYNIGVSTGIDEFSGMADPTGEPEGLFGTARVTVVPEPATLALLSLGTLGLIRRRFA